MCWVKPLLCGAKVGKKAYLALFKLTYKMKLYFATGNQKKCEEVRSNMPDWIEFECKSIDLPEKQTLDLIEISRQKALVAFHKLKKPVIVDDT